MSSAFKWSHCRRIEVNAAVQNPDALDRIRMSALTYRMVATRYNETIKSERSSAYITLSKARVWLSEGWSVTITDPGGKKFAVSEFETLVSGMLPLPVSAQETAIAPEAEIAGDSEAGVTGESGSGTDKLVVV
jgi:hypothetical protein